MNFLFDTSAILIYLKNTEQRAWIDENLAPLSPGNTAIISAVALGELESIALRNQWGKKRKEGLDTFINKFLVTDINSKDLIKRYAEIDAFSQGKLTDPPLGDSARNMGKNDLWIAATASVTNSSLLSADKDFKHLNGVYLDLVLLEI